MSSVLFDTPGPRTRARYRVYNALAVLGILGLLALALAKLGAKGQLDYSLWEPFVTPDYVRVLLVEGLLKTLEMAFTSVLLAVVLGLLLGLGKLSDHGWVRRLCWVVVEFFRAVPVLMLMIFIFAAYGADKGDAGSYWSVVVALTLYNGAVLAEVFRAGINALPSGQAEAAYALGLRKTQVMTSVLLPQAVKVMIPAIVSQCVVAVKDTALGYVILAPGVVEIGRRIYIQFHNQLPAAIVLAVVFILVNLALTWVAHRVQRRLAA